ncbi:hypothetical protein N7468_003212 [Penicillium chermesinum]|uniref:Uncharacterized protein n=1 Tax=Penicillium chermesinum TaxID=63820 RepID=A0A9W9P609_9EURO|nr:uncharacterized protein N7468_003212 [Penicillium chermesinum]KAJ5238593.1 hypothetical protein N7468_003212 [Penicillium chermesinum]
MDLPPRTDVAQRYSIEAEKSDLGNLLHYKSSSELYLHLHENLEISVWSSIAFKLSLPNVCNYTAIVIDMSNLNVRMACSPSFLPCEPQLRHHDLCYTGFGGVHRLSLLHTVFHTKH